MVDIPQTNKKKILVIGYGSMGKKYENFLKNNYEIYFFDKISKKKKNFLKNISHSLIKQFYFIVIATPPNHHKKYCDLCIKANKDFIVEKPLFLNKRGWRKTILNIKKKKLICSVAYPRRHSKAHKFIKSYIKKGKIGKLKIIKSNFSQDFRNLRKDYKKIYYSNMKESGGIIYDALSHHINLLSLYGGKIKKITKSEMKLAYTDVNVNDTGFLLIYFKKKIFGIIFGNQFQKPNIDELEFIGTNSNIIFDRIQNQITILKKGRRILKRFKETYDDLFKNQINDFINCKKNKIQPKTTLDEDFENLGKL